jgi:hypothetical protein
VAMVGRLVQKYETAQKEKQYTIHKNNKNTEYTKQKTKTNIKRILKKSNN